VGDAGVWRFPVTLGDEELHGCSRTRELDGEDARPGGVARPEGPVCAIEVRYGGAVGRGSWTAVARPQQRLSDSIAYESGSSPRTLVMRAAHLWSADRVNHGPGLGNVLIPIRWAHAGSLRRLVTTPVRSARAPHREPSALHRQPSPQDRLRHEPHPEAILDARS
jgi:hypothetical protein